MFRVHICLDEGTGLEYREQGGWSTLRWLEYPERGVGVNGLDSLVA